MVKEERLKSRILVVGASGMLGHALFHALWATGKYDVHGTVRNLKSGISAFFPPGGGRVHEGVDVHEYDTVENVIETLRPNYVLNCVGVIKQLDASNVPVESIYVNSLLPHRLAKSCSALNAKLIHFSTDCVFSGDSGGYKEDDLPDATDLYGRSKLLGEVNYGGHLTLRTSILGHELATCHSLIDWFLNQQGKVKGFRKAIFSGLPTVEIARVLDKHVFEQAIVSGLLHLSAEPINKYDLLCLVRNVYGKQIEIEAVDDVMIDRSLDSEKFRRLTKYSPPSWPELIRRMHHDYKAYYEAKKTLKEKA